MLRVTGLVGSVGGIVVGKVVAAVATKSGPAVGEVAGFGASSAKPSVVTDFRFSGGGRRGTNVKGLVGPPNSVVQGASPGRVFQANDLGEVIAAITADRVKPVVPG